MKVCLACNQRFHQVTWICPACGYCPPLKEGHLAFAPELAETSAGFEAKFFTQLVELEANNFWFRARNRLIIWALQRYFPHTRNFLEIGCGTGFVLAGIKQALPHLTVYGSEIFTKGLEFAAQRLANTQLFQMDARHLPFEHEFEVIGAFDVLEHVKEDTTILGEMYKATLPKGGIILTVPQHPWLWSQTDEYAHHIRRYHAKELKNKVEKAGFQVERMTSFVFILLPLMMMSRLRPKKQRANVDVIAELKMSDITNFLLEKILDIERGFIRAGLSFPVGGSLLVVARKLA
ncbi:MAG: SAM-dependent methyltransferase [Beggiatoa sp. IS2]|nr:MAG: SAM-dependent methyltransferase [Beggiatoa sp. IS2]